MSVNSKMTAIANEIRELSGTSGTMGLDVMATNLGEVNTEVDSQTNLITQIMDALGIATYYTVTYNLDENITSSNTATKIRSGDTYQTTLFVETFWDTVTVTMNGETVFEYPNNDFADINIVVENVTGDIVINATDSSFGEW